MNTAKFILLFTLFLLVKKAAHTQGNNPQFLVPYRYKNLWGYSDTLGTVKIKPAYDSVSFFYYKPYAEVYRNKKMSLIDSVVIVPLEQQRFDGSRAFYKLYINKKEGVWTRGSLILPAYDKIKMIYTENEIQIVAAKHKRYGVINEKGEILIPFSYEALSRLNYPENVFVTTKNGLKGAYVFHSVYSAIKNKYESLVYNNSLRVNSGWQFIIFKVVKDGREGLVGENGVEYFVD